MSLRKWFSAFVAALVLLTSTVGDAQSFQVRRIPVLSQSLYSGAAVALDFTKSRYRNGLGRGVQTRSFSSLSGLTFSRTGAGYAETSTGTLVNFATGVPRITDKGFLIEEARTNLLLRSQEFSNASWGKVAGTVSADAIAAPDGTVTADAFVPNAGSVNAYTGQTPTVSSATAYTWSVYAKNGALGTNWVELTVVSTSTWRAWFNLATGAKGSSSGTPTSYNISALTNGWYRLDITITTGTTTAECDIAARSADASTANITGDGATPAFYPWQGDLQAGAFPTSPIVTTTASATRGADSAVISGITFPSQGTLAVRWDDSTSFASSVRRLAELMVDASNGIQIEQANAGGTGAGTEYPAVMVTAGVAVAALDTGAVSSGAQSLAFSFATNDFRASRNGGAVVTDSSGALPTGTASLYIGKDISSAQQPNAFIKRILLYQGTSSDAGLQGAMQ